VGISLRLEELRLGSNRAVCALAQLARARVQFGEGGSRGAGSLPRLAKDVGSRDEFLEVGITVILEEVEVDVRDIQGVSRGEAHVAGLRLGADVHHGASELVGSVVGREAWPETLKREAAAPSEDISVLGGGIGGPEDEGGDAWEVNGGVAKSQDRALVVIGKALADTREVLDDGDTELLKLSTGTDSAEFQDLGRVEGTTGNDDFLGGKDLGCWGGFGATNMLRVGPVKRRTLQNLNADGPRRGGTHTSRVGEEHLGHKSVELDGQRELGGVGQGRADVVVGAAALAVLSSVLDHVVEGCDLVAVLVVGKNVTVEKVCCLGRVLAGQSGHLLQDLCSRQVAIFGPRNISGRSLEPSYTIVSTIEEPNGAKSKLTVVPMRGIASSEVVVSLNGLVVLSHFARLPAGIPSHFDDQVPILILWQGANGAVVHGAAPQHGCTRVLNAQVLGLRRRVSADIEGAITGIVGRVLEGELSRRVVRVLHPEIPTAGFVIGGLVEVLEIGIRRVIAFVATGLNQQRLVPGPSQVGGERATTRATSDDDVVVGSRGLTVHGRDGRGRDQR